MKFNNTLIKGKKKSILSLFGNAQGSILRSSTSWILFFLSLINFITIELCSIFLAKNHDELDFKNNLQYTILIFINIFLFLFILTNTIKIFADQLSNGMFLMLISKPYSRLTIFFSKIISLCFITILFIGFNLGSTLLTGYLIDLFTKHKWFFPILFKTIKWLAIYSLLFIALLISVTVFLSLVLSPQAVFLILVIFSSMFLLGGLVHTVFVKTFDPIELRFIDNGKKKDVNVKSITQRLIFKDKIKTNTFKYMKFTKKIYDFYNGLTIEEIYRINNSSESKLKQLEVFNQMNLYKPHTQVIENGTIIKWLDDSSFDEKSITLNLNFTKYFKSESELDNSNIYHQEIKQMMKEYYDINIKNYIKERLDKSCDFLEFNDSKTTINISSSRSLNHTSTGDNSSRNFNIGQILNGAQSKIKFDPDFTENLKNVFYNFVYYVVKSAEENIKEKVIQLKKFENYGFDLTHSSYKRYKNIINLYKIISYINLIEHWNQLWTSLQPEEKYWFIIDNLSMLNLEKHHNQLLSYKTFPLQFQSDGKIKLNITEADYILNYKYCIYAYGAISLFLFIWSIIIIVRKDIV